MKQKNLVHETGDGWKLTESGMREAEGEIARLQSSESEISTTSKSKGKGKAKGVRRGRK